MREVNLAVVTPERYGRGVRAASAAIMRGDPDLMRKMLDELIREP
jgi:hypothetical protein